MLRAWVVPLFSGSNGRGTVRTSPPHKAEANNPSESAITVREHIVFDGNKGWKHGSITYRLACGTAVEKAPNGDLLCWWLSGSGSEPATDNNVLDGVSTDQGKTWGKPSILVPAGAMAAAVVCMYPTSDGRLIAFAAHWPADKRSASGRTSVWNRTITAIPGATRNRCPFTTTTLPSQSHELANGEYLFAASFFDQRPEPLVAPVSAAVVHAKRKRRGLRHAKRRRWAARREVLDPPARLLVLVAG